MTSKLELKAHDENFFFCQGTIILDTFFNPINKGADYKLPKNRSLGSLVTMVSLALSTVLRIRYLVNID